MPDRLGSLGARQEKLIRTVSSAVLLVGALVVLMASTAALRSCNSRIDSTPISNPKQDIRYISAAVRLYLEREGRYPATLAAVVEAGYLPRAPKDPWDHSYKYSLTPPVPIERELPFYIWSYGAEGDEGEKENPIYIGNWNSFDDGQGWR